jgi:hypothetical protein
MLRAIGFAAASKAARKLWDHDGTKKVVQSARESVGDAIAGKTPSGPKRKTISTRITKETRNALEDACVITGRSLSQEIELRLVQSFDKDMFSAIADKLDNIEGFISGLRYEGYEDDNPSKAPESPVDNGLRWVNPDTGEVWEGLERVMEDVEALSDPDGWCPPGEVPDLK